MDNWNICNVYWKLGKKQSKAENIYTSINGGTDKLEYSQCSAYQWESINYKHDNMGVTSPISLWGKKIISHKIHTVLYKTMTKGQFVGIGTVVILSGPFWFQRTQGFFLKFILILLTTLVFYMWLVAVEEGSLFHKNRMCKLWCIFMAPCILTQANQSSYLAIEALANLSRYFPGLFKQWYREGCWSWSKGDSS